MHVPGSRLYRWALLALTILCVGVLALPAAHLQAVEVPPVGASVYIQTNGPNAWTGVGDWYSTTTNGKAVRGYHYLSINVPCDWPATRPLDIDLFSPEMNTTNFGTDTRPEESQNSTLTVGDPTNNLFSTQFELYDASVPFGPAINQPGPAAPGSIAVQTFAPATTPETWIRFHTLAAPVTCGSYILRSESRDDDQNGWRLRVGDDNDADPNNAPPADYDDDDLLPGTGDEITIGLIQVAYQQDIFNFVGGTNNVARCLTLFEYVEPGQATVTFNNFDMDRGGATPDPPPSNNLNRVRYYAPSEPVDPTATTGGIAGRVSLDTNWNGNDGGSSQVRVGDTINNPESGWWKVVTCTSYHNQFIQEAQNSVQAFYTQPPTPRMELAKTNPVTETINGQVLTYTLRFTNTSNLAPPTPPVPGPATNIILTDTLPIDLTYTSCAVLAPLAGTCAHNGVNPGGAVTFTIATTLKPGESGALRVVSQVNNSDGNATNPIINLATLTFKDPLKNTFPPITSTVNIPTPIALAGFGARWLGDGVRLNWRTGGEEKTAGFHLLRASSPDLAAASQVTAALIPARGTGSSYAWTDADAAPGAVYYYWLRASDLDGGTSTHGPVSPAGSGGAAIYQQFLPFIQR